MATNPFSIVAASSKVADRFDRAIVETSKRMGEARRDRVQSVQKKVDELKSRGLLRRQKYSAATAADFQRFNT